MTMRYGMTTTASVMFLIAVIGIMSVSMSLPGVANAQSADSPSSLPGTPVQLSGSSVSLTGHDDTGTIEVTLRVHSDRPSYVPSSLDAGNSDSWEATPWDQVEVGDTRTLTFSKGSSVIKLHWHVTDGGQIAASTERSSSSSSPSSSLSSSSSPSSSLPGTPVSVPNVVLTGHDDTGTIEVTLQVHTDRPSYVPSSLDAGNSDSWEATPWDQVEVGDTRTLTFSKGGQSLIKLHWHVTDGGQIAASTERILLLSSSSSSSDDAGGSAQDGSDSSPPQKGDTAGGSSANPAAPPLVLQQTTGTISETVSVNTPIPDNTKSMDTTSTISVSEGVTIEHLLVTVNIDHTHIGDLRVAITPPGGVPTLLHDQRGLGLRSQIFETYSSADNPVLASLVGTHYAAGDWTLSVGDYIEEDTGTLNYWELTITYDNDLPLTPSTPASLPTGPETAFADNFESSLTKWTQSGEGDWRVDTSGAHNVPAVPNHHPSNKVLHVDDCDTKCTITLKDPIDLSGYESATLSFSRFVDGRLGYDEHLTVELYDGTSWNHAYYWTHANGDDHKWNDESYDLARYLVTTDFKIRFVAHASVTTDDIQLDNILINGTVATGSSPTVAYPFVDNVGSSSLTDKWVETGEGDWKIDRSGSHHAPLQSGHGPSNRLLHVDDCDTTCTITLKDPIDLSEYKSATLLFSRFVDFNLDPDDYLKVELYDGTSWNEVYRWSGSNGDDHLWHDESYDLIKYITATDFKIRFVAHASHAAENIQIDNIFVTGSDVPPPPPPFEITEVNGVSCTTTCDVPRQFFVIEGVNAEPNQSLSVLRVTTLGPPGTSNFVCSGSSDSNGNFRCQAGFLGTVGHTYDITVRLASDTNVKTRTVAVTVV